MPPQCDCYWFEAPTSQPCSAELHALGIERRLNGDDYDNGSVAMMKLVVMDFADTAAADSVNYNGDNGGNEQGRGWR